MAMRQWQRALGGAVLSLVVAAPALAQANRNAVDRQEVREAREELVKGLNEIDQQRDAAMREAREAAERRPNAFDEQRQQIVQRFVQQRDRLLDRYEQRLLGEASGSGQVYGMNEPPESDREGRAVWLRQQLARVNGQIAEEQALHEERMERLTAVRGRSGPSGQQVNRLIERENNRHEEALEPLQQRQQQLRQRYRQVRGEDTQAEDPGRINQLLDALEREINAGSN